jgi:hypothetical protein
VVVRTGIAYLKCATKTAEEKTVSHNSRRNRPATIRRKPPTATRPK